MLMRGCCLCSRHTADEVVDRRILARAARAGSGRRLTADKEVNQSPQWIGDIENGIVIEVHGIFASRIAHTHEQKEQSIERIVDGHETILV